MAHGFILPESGIEKNKPTSLYVLKQYLTLANCLV